MSFSNDLEKISYALGMNVCEQFMHMPIKVDFAALQKGVAAYSSGKDVALSPEEYRDALQSFQKMMQEAEKHMARGLMKITDGNLSLTHQGLYISDDVMSDFMIV